MPSTRKMKITDSELLDFLEKDLNGSYETIGHLQYQSHGYFPEGQPYYVGDISRYFGCSLREAITNAMIDNYDHAQENFYM